MLARHEAPMIMVVNIKGGNHKLFQYSDRAMADLKVQTGQSYSATNVCFQLATTIWYGQEKYSKQITIYFPGEINNLKHIWKSTTSLAMPCRPLLIR